MYKNKTVIISCAGMGKRLGMGIPKALIKICGKSLILRQLEMLKDVEDVRIVVGYKAEEIIKEVKKYRKDITFVFNHDYMNTGTGASVCLAAKYANENIITIDGDLLIHPSDIQKILNHDGDFVGVCKASTDNPMLTVVKNGKVTEFSRERGQFEWTGISQFKTKNLQMGHGHVCQLLEPHLPIKMLFLRTKEIDTQNDYINAEKWVKNNYSDNITIGVVGGMGSIATVNFFERIVNSFPAEKEWDRPRIIIDNKCNMPSRVRAVLYNERREELVESLTDSISMMINNNCDYVVLSCNTSHIFLKDIYMKHPNFKEKIINIIEECCKELNDFGIKRINLLASEGTILSNVYSECLDKFKIIVETLTQKDYILFRKWIEAVKQNIITDDIKNSFIDYINNCNSDNIVLGCTELPILYEMCKNKIKKDIFDPLQSVINVLVKYQQNRIN